MKYMQMTIIALIGILISGGAIAGQIQVFNDRSTFISDTGSSSATGPIPLLGQVITNNNPATVTLGSITFGLNDGTNLFFGRNPNTPFGSGNDWTTLTPGNDIAITGLEGLNLDFESSVFSAGFEFAEPTSENVGGPFIDSTFDAIGFDDANAVFSFSFNAPNDILAFVGVWSDMAFNRIEITERLGGIENEFYGEFFTGMAPLTTPVPEPSTLILMSLGLAGIGWQRKRLCRK